MDDPRAEAILAAIHHGPTGVQLTAEPVFLARLDGSCDTPIAGLAVLDGDQLWLRGEILRRDGSRVIKGEVRGPQGDAAVLGTGLAADLLAQAGEGLFDCSVGWGFHTPHSPVTYLRAEDDIFR